MKHLNSTIHQVIITMICVFYTLPLYLVFEYFFIFILNIVYLDMDALLYVYLQLFPHIF